MREKQRKEKSIPIAAFETIGERCKGSRRLSKKPKRFETEFNYVPKGVVKSEPQEHHQFDHHLDDFQNVFQSQNDRSLNKSKPKRVYNNRGLKRHITKESNDLNDFAIGGQVVDNKRVLNKYYNCMDLSPIDNNQSFGQIRGINCTANDSQSNQYLNDKHLSPLTIHTPPKLFPVIDIDPDDSDNDCEVSSPPILYEKSVLFAKNQKINANMTKNIKQRPLKVNLENVESIYDLNTNIEFRRMREQLMDTEQHMNVLKTQLVRLNNEFYKLKIEKSKLASDNERLNRQLSQQEMDLEKRVRELKSTHWCHVCLSEAAYYCCWAGSYCSRKCQNTDWKSGHKSNCRRDRK